MATNFYMQKYGGNEIDIESEFNIRVTSVRGLNPPQPKDLFTRDWASENGLDYYVPSERNCKSSDVVMSILAQDDTDTAIEKYRAFCDYLFDGVFTYHDTLQNQQVIIVYNANKPEWYQFIGNAQLMAEITFLNPSGQVTKYVAP
jgi:hypothetical protein